VPGLLLAMNFSGALAGSSYFVNLSAQLGNTPGGAVRSWSVDGASLYFNEGWLQGWEMNLGRRAYSQMSTLIYSAPGRPAKLNFFDRAAAPDPAYLAPPSGERTVEGLRIWKHGALEFWPFSNTIFVATTPEQFYQSFNDRRVSEMAARVDVANLDFFGLLQNAQPYLVGLWMSNDQAEISSYGNIIPSESNQAYAVGLDSQLAGGGTLLLEAATSKWQRADLSSAGLEFNDTAFFVTASKQLGFLKLVGDYSMVGPRFVTEAQQGFYTKNWQAGATLDSSVLDPRPGNAGRLSWQSISRQPSLLVNNTSRAAFKLEAAWSWGKFGGGLSSATQLERSGPWLQSSHFVGGNGGNSADWYYLFYNDFALMTPASPMPASLGGAALWRYNKATQAPAYYNSVSTSANWDELTQKVYLDNQETLLLSAGGVGDPVLRPDSLKSLNCLQGALQLDFASLFDRLLPAELDLDGEWRDNAEEQRFPRFDGQGLLSQGIAQASLRFGLSRQVDFVSMLAHETWFSRAGLFPVDYRDLMWGLGFDFRLEKYLSGLGADLRYRSLEHADLNFPERNFSGWNLSLATSLTY
jgi:hypothetical protein